MGGLEETTKLSKKYSELFWWIIRNHIQVQNSSDLLIWDHVR